MNNLNLIIGEDSKLTGFYLHDILKKIDYIDDNKITYDMSINSIDDILDEASMISLFSQVKVIIGNNLDISKINDNSLEYLSKYIANKNKDVYIIFISDKVDARTKSYKIFKDNFNIIDTSKTNNKDELYDYVKTLIKDKKYKIDNVNIEYFLSKVGNDINNINLELEKIFIYKEEDKTINSEDIDLLINDSIDNIIYEFTNAILDNDYDKIVKMYNDFKKENIYFDYLITSLANVFRQVLIIKILKNDGESNLNISKFIGKKEFYVKKMLERIYRYTEEDLAKFISKLADIERDYKSGKSNIDMLELFIIDKER